MATYGHEGGYAFNEDQRGGHQKESLSDIDLDYDDVVRTVKNLPASWYPAILINLVEAAYEKRVFQPSGASITVAKAEERNGTACDTPQLQTRLAKSEKQLSDLSLVVVTLARSLPDGNDVRKVALEYLDREGLMPSPLR